ncbi:MAG: PDZ domain-containing protein [Desulfobacterales bacterium]|nr:PDZ domain-containing protein [Desulfobacterales bacterium]
MKKLILAFIALQLLYPNVSFAERYGGVGLIFGVAVVPDENQNIASIPIVTDVISGTPSSQNGIKAGDILLLVDGQVVLGKSSEFISNQVRGPVNSSVNLRIFRPSEDCAFDIRLTRVDVVIEDERQRQAKAKPEDSQDDQRGGWNSEYLSIDPGVYYFYLRQAKIRGYKGEEAEAYVRSAVKSAPKTKRQAGRKCSYSESHVKHITDQLKKAYNLFSAAPSSASAAENMLTTYRDVHEIIDNPSCQSEDDVIELNIQYEEITDKVRGIAAKAAKNLSQ